MLLTPSHQGSPNEGTGLRQTCLSRNCGSGGNPTRLEQIIVNLLVNAIKFTPHGGKISLCAAAQGTEVEISVRDNGPGIPDELLPKIFDTFVQGAQTLARSDGGLGIGLMLVRTFVQHDKQFHEFSINDDGLEIGAPFVRVPTALLGIASVS